MTGVTAGDPQPVVAGNPADDGEEVHHHPEDPRPAVVDPQRATEEAVDELLERGLHPVGELLVGGELGVEGHVAEAAGDDAAVGRLVPVIEPVAAVMRRLEQPLGERARWRSPDRASG